MVKSGFLCFGPSFFASAAFILSIFANSRCNLVSVNTASTALNFWGPYEPHVLGLWCYEATNGLNYSTKDLTGDSKFEAARGLGTATLALGFCIWLFYLFAGCCRFGPPLFRGIGFLGVITCLMQGLVFLVQKSVVCENGCGLGVGGKCGIAACACWFVAGVFSCGAGKEAEEAQGARSEPSAEP